MKHLIEFILQVSSFILFVQNKIYLNENWKKNMNNNAEIYHIFRKEVEFYCRGKQTL